MAKLLSNKADAYKPSTVKERAVVAMATQIAREVGLDLFKWEIGVHGGTRSLGQCVIQYQGWANKVTRAAIHISRNVIRRLDVADPRINEIVRHEIAHALAFDETGRLAHCKTWAAWCDRLGIPANRSISASDLTCKVAVARKAKKEAIGSKWVLVFQDEVLRKYDRKPSSVAKNINTLYVTGRRTETIGKLRLIQQR